MLSISTRTKIYLVAGVTDMRKAFGGLTAIVKNHLCEDPLSGHVFVFCNRRRDRIKVLFFDRSGAVGLRQAAGERDIRMAGDRREIDRDDE